MRRHIFRAVAQSLAPMAIVYALLFLISAPVKGDIKPINRILILNEVGPSYPVIKLIDQGIRTGLERSPFKLEFYHEYFDILLFPEPAAQGQLHDFYLRKYQYRMPDVVITVRPAPLKFMIETHAKFFPEAPVVFCLPNGLVHGSPTVDSNFTGIETDFAVSETLDAALRLKPDTEHVVVIGGVAAYDKQREAIVKQQLNGYAKRLDISYLTDLAMPVLLERLSHLPKHTVVLITAIGHTAGTHFFSDEIGPVISTAANAPVLSLADVYIGHGEVGGDMADLTHQGMIAAQLALRILAGQNPKGIARVSHTTPYIFDWKALHRWGLSERNLPSGSVLLNRKPSFWEIYHRYVIAAILIFLAQSVVIGALLWHRARRRKAEAELRWRLDLESLIADLSSLFVSFQDDEVDASIERSMAVIGEFLNLDRISLFETSDNRSEMKRVCSWEREGVPHAAATIDAGSLPWWREHLLRGDVAVTSTPEDLPIEASKEQEYFRNQRIVSAVSVPLKVGGQVTGAMSFATTSQRRTWTADVVSQLRVVAEISWNTLQRRRAEAVVRESEERFRLVASAAPVMIWMSGPDKLRTYFNPPWLEFTGGSLEHELGNGWAEGVHCQDLQRCLETYSTSFDLRKPFEMEYRLRRHDGEYRWVFDRGVPRFNADGSFAGYIGSCLDVTERKAAEEALSTVSRRLIEAHEEERTWIARELHDDINQRIALLSVTLEKLFQNVPHSGGRTQKGVAEIRASLASLGTDIQALSHRLHSSKLQYLGLAVAARSFCQELSERQNVQIDFEVEGSFKMLPEGTGLCLFRVLQEALQNAIKHSGVQQFEVSLKATDTGIELRVHDSGTGFDPERVVDGHGLGLISMRERVKLVEGQFSIQSKASVGTTIRASVPFAVKAKSAASA